MQIAASGNLGQTSTEETALTRAQLLNSTHLSRSEILSEVLKGRDVFADEIRDVAAHLAR